MPVSASTVMISGQSTAARNRRQRLTPTVARGSARPVPFTAPPIRPLRARTRGMIASRDARLHGGSLRSRGFLLGRQLLACSLGGLARFPLALGLRAVLRVHLLGPLRLRSCIG